MAAVNHFSTNTYDVVFKGKWYSNILELDLRACFPGRGHMQNVGARATTALLATLDLNQSWAEHLLKPVAEVLDSQ